MYRQWALGKLIAVMGLVVTSVSSANHGIFVNDNRYLMAENLHISKQKVEDGFVYIEVDYDLPCWAKNVQDLALEDRLPQSGGSLLVYGVMLERVKSPSSCSGVSREWWGKIFQPSNPNFLGVRLINPKTTSVDETEYLLSKNLRVESVGQMLEGWKYPIVLRHELPCWANSLTAFEVVHVLERKPNGEIKAFGRVIGVLGRGKPWSCLGKNTETISTIVKTYASDYSEFKGLKLIYPEPH